MGDDVHLEDDQSEHNPQPDTLGEGKEEDAGKEDDIQSPNGF